MDPCLINYNTPITFKQKRHCRAEVFLKNFVPQLFFLIGGVILIHNAINSKKEITTLGQLIFGDIWGLLLPQIPLRNFATLVFFVFVFVFFFFQISYYVFSHCFHIYTLWCNLQTCKQPEHLMHICSIKLKKPHCQKHLKNFCHYLSCLTS